MGGGLGMRRGGADDVEAGTERAPRSFQLGVSGAFEVASRSRLRSSAAEKVLQVRLRRLPRHAHATIRRMTYNDGPVYVGTYRRTRPALRAVRDVEDAEPADAKGARGASHAHGRGSALDASLVELVALARHAREFLEALELARLQRHGGAFWTGEVPGAGGCSGGGGEGGGGGTGSVGDGPAVAAGSASSPRAAAAAAAALPTLLIPPAGSRTPQGGPPPGPFSPAARLPVASGAAPAPMVRWPSALVDSGWAVAATPASPARGGVRVREVAEDVLGTLSRRSMGAQASSSSSSHYGVLRTLDGWTFAGPNVAQQFVPGALHGQGMVCAPEGDVWSGLWFAGKAHGWATLASRSDTESACSVDRLCILPVNLPSPGPLPLTPSLPQSELESSPTATRPDSGRCPRAESCWWESGTHVRRCCTGMASSDWRTGRGTAVGSSEGAGTGMGRGGCQMGRCYAGGSGWGRWRRERRATRTGDGTGASFAPTRRTPGARCSCTPTGIATWVRSLRVACTVPAR